MILPCLDQCQQVLCKNSYLLLANELARLELTLDPVSGLDSTSGEAVPALDPTGSLTSQPTYVFPDIVHLDPGIQDLTEQRIES